MNKPVLMKWPGSQLIDYVRLFWPGYRYGRESDIAAERLQAAERLKGFKPHKEGFVHLLCYGCGQKMSNATTFTPGLEPDGTVLIECLCPKCAEGTMGSEEFYYDKDGMEIRSE